MEIPRPLLRFPSPQAASMTSASSSLCLMVGETRQDQSESPIWDVDQSETEPDESRSPLPGCVDDHSDGDDDQE